MEPYCKHVVGNMDLYYRAMNFWKAWITSHLFSISKTWHRGKLVGASKCFLNYLLAYVIDHGGKRR